MENREAALQEIYERLKENYQDIGLKTFRRTPTVAITENQFPYVIMDEGVDSVIGRSSRGRTGFGTKRSCEVIIEIGVFTSTGVDIRTMFLAVRKAIFAERGTGLEKYNNVLLNNTFIEENRTEGPFGVDIPNILVMKIVLDLIYVDNTF